MTQNEKSKIRAKVIKWVTRLFLILVAIIMLYPLAWNVVSSFKTSTEFLTDPFAWPQGLAWDNYVRAYEKSNLAANIGNSIYVVLETLVIIVICVVPCSYCLVRYKFPGAKLILNIYMAAIFIQATYIMIPLFLQMNKLNLLNSLTALGVLYATMQFPFAIFLLTGFLRSIPRDYEEAAMIDGCGPFRILTSIIIPMCKPGIVTVCMISAMAAWNEYPVALVMVTDPTKATLPVGLANLYEIQRYATDWGALFAALILRGYWIALHTRDRFGTLLVVGFTTQLAVQVFLNISVVTGLLPTTGISLPFFSYGGTALSIQLAEMGIVLSVSRQMKPTKAG